MLNLTRYGSVRQVANQTTDPQVLVLMSGNIKLNGATAKLFKMNDLLTFTPEEGAENPNENKPSYYVEVAVNNEGTDDEELLIGVTPDGVGGKLDKSGQYLVATKKSFAGVLGQRGRLFDVSPEPLYAADAEGNKTGVAWHQLTVTEAAEGEDNGPFTEEEIAQYKADKAAGRASDDDTDAAETTEGEAAPKGRGRGRKQD